MDRMILSANANLNNLRNKLRIDPPKLINLILIISVIIYVILETYNEMKISDHKIFETVFVLLLIARYISKQVLIKRSKFVINERFCICLMLSFSFLNFIKFEKI